MGKKIYSLAHNIKGVYIVPATLLSILYWFVNNYINWNQFNTPYDKDYEMKKMHT